MVSSKSPPQTECSSQCAGGDGEAWAGCLRAASSGARWMEQWGRVIKGVSSRDAAKECAVMTSTENFDRRGWYDPNEPLLVTVG